MVMTPHKNHLKTKKSAYLMPNFSPTNVLRVPSGFFFGCLCFLLTSCFLSTGPHATESAVIRPELLLLLFYSRLQQLHHLKRLRLFGVRLHGAELAELRSPNQRVAGMHDGATPSLRGNQKKERELPYSFFRVNIVPWHGEKRWFRGFWTF